MTFVTRNLCLMFAMTVAVLGLTGCSSAPAPPSELALVEGKLLLDGEPLTGASITLMPQDANGQASAGTSDAAGTFRLRTLDGHAGAKPGKYKVLITGRPSGGYAPPPLPDEVAMPAKVPAHYGLPANTPLTLNVPPPYPLTIELRSH